MSKRIDTYQQSPETYKGLLAAKSTLQNSSIPIELIELVNLRVSQINGCAYCIDMHSRDLLKKGMSTDKLVLVPVWDEAGALFSDREKAALAWAEVLTNIKDTHASDEDYAAVTAHFNEKEYADLTLAIVLMNALNRLGISGRMTPLAAKG